jgi:hypothetical protein
VSLYVDFDASDAAFSALFAILLGKNGGTYSLPIFSMW